MSNSPRHEFPYIVQSQSGKEVTHNEALNMLELLLQSAVTSVSSAPSTAPTEGALYLISTAPSGDWSTRANYIAGRVSSSWVYCAPKEGYRLWDRGTATPLLYQSSAWVNELAANAKIGFFGGTPSTKDTVTLGSTDNYISSLTFSATYASTQLDDFKLAAEQLQDDMRAIKAALSSYGLI